MLTFPIGLLANKGGIDPEVEAWAARVVTNSGTVSASTLGYVNDFVVALKLAGLRSRFLRLNLFVGDQLAAGLTPLFLNETESTSVFYGNTYETNTNFVGGDYSESGASGGIQGDGTTKYLDTGFNPSLISQIGLDSGAMLVYNRTVSIINSFMCGVTVTAPSTVRFALQYSSGYNGYNMDNNSGSSIGSGKGLAITSRISATTKRGFLNSTQTTNDVTSSVFKPNGNIFVFASSLGVSPFLRSDTLLNCYGLLDSIANDTEANSIATLLNDFYTLYSRNEY